MLKVVTVAVLFAALAYCQETLDADSNVADVADRKEKRGIALNLGGGGLEGYSYLGPSSRGMNYRGYTPITEYGYDGVNYGGSASNFAGGYQGGYQGGYNQPYGQYPYRTGGYQGGYQGGYPTSYSYQRQYSTPVSTFPLGGIGTVGPYGGGAYGGFNGGGFNRFGNDGLGIGGVGGGYQQQQGGYF